MELRWVFRGEGGFSNGKTSIGRSVPRAEKAQKGHESGGVGTLDPIGSSVARTEITRSQLKQKELRCRSQEFRGS